MQVLEAREARRCLSLRPRWSSALKVALASHIALNQPDLAASTLRELEHQNDTCGDMLNSFAKLHQPGPPTCLGHPAGSCRCSERHAWRPGWPSIGSSARLMQSLRPLVSPVTFMQSNVIEPLGRKSGQQGADDG